MATVRARELYNEIAVDYSAIKTNPFKRWIEETTFLNAIRHTNNGEDDPSILDLGCGSGHFCRLLQEQGMAQTVYGIDVSDTMIADAKRIEAAAAGGPTLTTTRGVQYYRMDLLAKNVSFQKILGNKTVDVCVSAYLLPYAASLKELHQFCSAAAQALGPGGRFISVTTLLTPTMRRTATRGGVLESTTWGFSIVWDDKEQNNPSNDDSNTTKNGNRREDANGVLADATLFGNPARENADGVLALLADVTLFGNPARTQRVTFPNVFWSQDIITTMLQQCGFATVEWLPHTVDEQHAPADVVQDFRNINNDDRSALAAVGYFVAIKAE